MEKQLYLLIATALYLFRILVPAFVSSLVLVINILSIRQNETSKFIFLQRI